MPLCDGFIYELSPTHSMDSAKILTAHPTPIHIDSNERAAVLGTPTSNQIIISLICKNEKFNVGLSTQINKIIHRRRELSCLLRTREVLLLCVKNEHLSTVNYLFSPQIFFSYTADHQYGVCRETDHSWLTPSPRSVLVANETSSG